MHGSTNEQARSRAKAFWCAALCAAAVMVTTSAHADDDDRRRDKRRGEHRSWAHEHGPRHHHRHGDRHRDDRGWDHSSARDWRGHDDRRYYADEQPPLHRYGRRCGDRRHYHAVHYHVAARDYYDYYYPRYRYYGAAPVSAHASVIVTLPLF